MYHPLPFLNAFLTFPDKRALFNILTIKYVQTRCKQKRANSSSLRAVKAGNFGKNVSASKKKLWI